MDWTERYAAQPEILRYVNHVADRFDLRRDIQFDTRGRRGDVRRGRRPLDVATDGGERVDARYCVMATGCLSSAKRARLRGPRRLRGRLVPHRPWPHEGVDFTGKRVGVIGTGSSGIQSIPLIAEQAAHLYVFQRTPNFTLPAHNRPLDAGRPARGQGRLPRAPRRRAAQSALGVLDRSPTPSRRFDGRRRRARSASSRPAGQTGGFGIAVGAFNDLLDRRRGQRDRRRVRARQDPRDRARPGVGRAAVPARLPDRHQAARASTPTTTRPSTATTSTLVDVRDAPDRADHARRHPRTTDARVRARRRSSSRSASTR